MAEHGTRTMYVHYGCRCEACCKAEHEQYLKRPEAKMRKRVYSKWGDVERRKHARRHRKADGSKALKSREMRFAAKVDEVTRGRCEYVSGYERKGSRVAISCRTCGCVFHVTARHGAKYRCPECLKAEAEHKREAHRKMRRDAARKRHAAEMEKDKKCSICGAVYHSGQETSAYCSDKCKSKAHRSNHRKRARRHGADYESGITLRRLYERDNGTCAICGGRCDFDDRRWGPCGPSYPSIDHVVALARGGSHTWDNVQLACCMCNSIKSDRDMEEVTRDAQEQATGD